VKETIQIEDFRSQDSSGGAVQTHRKNLIQPDYALIQQVEMAVDGQSAHHAAGMIAAYLAGMEEAAESGDLRYLEFAEEAERALRMYLTTLRMRNAEFQKPF
jgi:hypothetical protein